MKKFFLVTVVALACATMVEAQPRAIGLNLGLPTSFSYQHGFGHDNMLDISLGVPFSFTTNETLNKTYVDCGINATVTYDWIDPFNTAIPWDKRGIWHWTMGVGAGGGLYFRTYHVANDIAEEFGTKVTEVTTPWHIGAAGHVGVAYDFWFPLELSVDWRPELGVYCTPTVAYDGSRAYDAGFYTPGLLYLQLGVRYLF